MKKCKWCNKELVDKRSDSLFCRRSCKGMFSRKKKIENEKRDRKV